MQADGDVPFYALPHTHEEMLARFEEERQRLMQTVRALSDEQLAAPSTPADWAVKDHLAHLATWALGIVALLKKENRWAAMGLDPNFVYQTESFDDINAVIYDLHKDQTLARVLTYFNDVHGQLVHILRQTPISDLYQTYSVYQPDEPGEDNGEPVIKWVINNSYSHYHEHLGWIQEMIAEKGWAQG